jgi:paraquat-inducible protein B
MKRKAHPTRIGLFMLGAVALLVAAVVVVSGGGLFTTRDRAVAYFEGSVYGLQLGAPVVFRGVRLGSVVGIGVVYQGQPGRYAIPVEVAIDRDRIASVKGPDARVTLADLVAQGLTAQLSMQSLLTGLLYVDLDLRPAGVVTATPAPRTTVAGVLPEIPTTANTIQALQKQLQDLDVGKLVDDVSAVAASARQLMSDPTLRRSLEASLSEAAGAGADLRRLLARLDQRVGPLADSLQGTLGATRRTAEQWGGAVDRVGSAVDRVGQAADSVTGSMGRFDRLADSAQPVLNSVQRAADDLARTAAALRSATADDTGLMQQFERAAQDMARASRAVRDLADLLERQPEALIRGRAATP